MDCCCVCHIWVDDSYGFAYVTSLFDRKNNAGGNGDAVSYLYCLSLQLPISNFLPLTWTIAAAADVFAVLIYLVLLHSRISLMVQAGNHCHTVRIL
ncbi:MAG: hypothetical protein ACLRRB_01470 [Ruminococcus sp.]